MGEELEKRSHQLNLCIHLSITSAVYLYNLVGWVGVTIRTFHHYEKTIHLIEAPGFEYSEREEEEVLEEWVYWLLKEYENGIKVIGLVYTHRIDEPQLSGSQHRGLQITKRICGTSNYPSVVMATMAWNNVTREEQSRAGKKGNGGTPQPGSRQDLHLPSARVRSEHPAAQR